MILFSLTGNAWGITATYTGQDTLPVKLSSATIAFTSAQSGSYTVTPGTGTWNGTPQGSLTVTPGSGTWTISGNVTPQGSLTVTAGSGTFTVSGNVTPQGSLTVTPGTGTWNGTPQGSLSVTPGTGTWSVSITSFSSTNPGWVVMGGTLPVNVSASTLTVTGQALTKGTQGALGFTTQDLKDSGRSVVIASATAVAASASEVTVSVSVSRGLTNAPAAGASQTITSGKTLRFQSVAATWTKGVNQGQTASVRLRAQNTGTCTASSPLLWTVNLSSFTAPSEFPDGIELSGNNTFCLSHIESGTGGAPTLDISLVGFEY